MEERKPEHRPLDRLTALRSAGLLDTPAEAGFDRLTRLAARLLDAPVALVSLVDEDRQFFKSQCGLPEPWASRRETPLSHSFCQHVVAARGPLVVEDARAHPLLRDSPAIPELGVVAYAGFPLTVGAGYVLGSFCVIDQHPRRWAREEIETLGELAHSVTTEIELRTALRLADRVRAEVEHKDQRLQMALVAGQLGAWELDLASDALVCTAQCKANFGRGPGTRFTYRDLIEAIHPDDRDLVRARVRQAVEQGTEYRAEYRVCWPNGEVHWIAAQGLVFRGRGGEPVRMTGFTQDVTEQVRARQELEELNQAKSDFLAVISHELRTPLTGIMAYADLLRMGIPEAIPERAQQQVGRIDSAARHLLTLIEEILTFSRVEAGQEDVRLDPVPLEEVIHDATTFLRPVAEKKGISLRVGPLESATVLTDHSKVRQIVTNLLSNAVKFTREGEVEIRLERSARQVRISVRDTGIGIAQEHLGKIFEPFWQVAQANTRTAGGTGLGLSVSRRIAHLIGGDLLAESVPGQGSRFTLVLPLRPGTGGRAQGGTV